MDRTALLGSPGPAPYFGSARYALASQPPALCATRFTWLAPVSSSTALTVASSRSRYHLCGGCEERGAQRARRPPRRAAPLPAASGSAEEAPAAPVPLLGSAAPEPELPREEGTCDIEPVLALDDGDGGDAEPAPLQRVRHGLLAVVGDWRGGEGAARDAVIFMRGACGVADGAWTGQLDRLNEAEEEERPAHRKESCSLGSCCLQGVLRVERGGSRDRQEGRRERATLAGAVSQEQRRDAAAGGERRMGKVRRQMDATVSMGAHQSLAK